MAQSGYVGEEIRLRLMWCDPENEAPGTIAANMPAGATLPDNGDGTRTFVWTPVESVDTQVTFTVYEESNRSIRTSITVPFKIVDNPVLELHWLRRSQRRTPVMSRPSPCLEESSLSPVWNCLQR
jgi:hypothetical protein